MEVGEPYNPYQFKQAIEKLQRIYENTGKPFAKIQYRINARGTDIYIHLNIQENQTVSVNQVRVSGLSHIKNTVIRREILLQSGDQYSGEDIRESQRRIFETGLFADVTIHPVPVSQDSQRVNLRVNVRELDFRTLRFDMGAGQYVLTKSEEPVSALETSVEWVHRNLLQSGRRLSFSTGLLFDVDNLQPWPNVEVKYTEPWIWKFRVPVTTRLFYEFRTYDFASEPIARWGTDITFCILSVEG